MYKFLKWKGNFLKGAKDVPLAVKVPENVIRSSENPINAEDYNEGTVWVKDTEKAWVNKLKPLTTPGRSMFIFPYFMTMCSYNGNFSSPITIGMLKSYFGEEDVSYFISEILMPLYSKIDTNDLQTRILNLIERKEKDINVWIREVSEITMCMLVTFTSDNMKYGGEVPDRIIDDEYCFEDKTYRNFIDTTWISAELRGNLSTKTLLLIPGLFRTSDEKNLHDLKISEIMVKGVDLSDELILGMLAISLNESFVSPLHIAVDETGSARVGFIAQNKVIFQTNAEVTMENERIILCVDLYSDAPKSTLSYVFGGTNPDETLNLIVDALIDPIVDKIFRNLTVGNSLFIMPVGGELQIEPDIVTYTHEWLD